MASLRDNLLVTAGARAGYMDMQGYIDLPTGSAGEDELAEFIVELVDDYIRYECESFDRYIESALYGKYGMKLEI